MKILYIHAAPVPSKAANAVQVAKMCSAFGSAGAKVTLGVPAQQAPDLAEQNVEELYGLPRPLDIKRFPRTRLPAAEFMFAWAALRSRRADTDLVYTRSITAGALAARLGYATVLELHAPAGALRSRQTRRLRWLLRSPRLRALVVISQKLKDHYVESFPDAAGKIVVAHDGADSADEAPHGEARSLKGAFKVGYVGHLYPGKGMEIIAPLARRCPWATFHIVGGTGPDLCAWKERLSSASNVVFHGHVPHHQTRAYLEGMDVVVAPYLRVVRGVGGGVVNLAEGMSPLKIFEYMAAGKSILSSDLPVLREILRDGGNALLCDPDGVDEWAHALARLYEDRDLRDCLAKQARRDFDARYSWGRRAEFILGVIAAS